MRSSTSFAAVLGTCAALLWLVRPRLVDWGATRDEAVASLPGDDILPIATVQTTRAITIDAQPASVWPWLVQMGPSPRAGVYTYDWIERRLGIDIENSDRILPEFQHMEPGEFFALGKDGSNGLYVRQVIPERAIVLQWKKESSTWAFVLNATGDGRTRLISRNRIVGAGPAFRMGMAVMLPASLVMERKMLQGIRERAGRRTGVQLTDQ
jgi:hypothetical protein